MAKLRMAHASTHGARKPPGPKYISYTNIPQNIWDPFWVSPKWVKSNEQRKREERRKKKSEGQFNTGEVNTWTNRKHIFPCRFPFLICAEICSLLSSTHFYPKFLPQGIFVPSQGEMFFAFLWFLQISSSERLFALPVSSVLCLVVFSTTLHLGELTWVYWMGLLNHHLHVSIPDINSI